MFGRHGTFALNSEACCRSLKSVLCILLKLVYLPDRYLEGESAFSRAQLHSFAEHVHNPELLYLLMAGKCKGTFDVFIMNSQLRLYMLDDLKL